MNINVRPRVVSLFSGAGCFDLGFEAAGFNTILTTDIDKDCCETIIANRDWQSVNSPIEAISASNFRSLTNLRRKDLELLIGGPPCQPYSKSANGAIGGSPLGFEDERANTIRHYFRAVDIFLPKVFIIENVPQFVTGSNERLKKYLLRSTARINSQNRTNYKLTFCKINAAWYGVPQLRERIFIVGVRDGSAFHMPEIRHLNHGDPELGLSPFRTVWDALGQSKLDLATDNLKIGGKWGDLIESIPPGQNYLWHTSRGGGRNIFAWRGRYWNFLLKLHPLYPSWTIAANPGHHTGPFHWENRRLTVCELQKLQTVPSDYIFAGSLASARKQIGNGVPSAIGELLGKEIRRQLLGERVNSNKLKLIPQERPVPIKIKHLVQACPVTPLRDMNHLKATGR